MAEPIYKRGLTFVSTTLTDHGDGIATGHMRRDRATGAKYILVKAAGTIADGCVCKASTSQTTTAAVDLSVVVTSATTSNAVCANNTGASRSSGEYFWAIVQGRGYGLGSTTIGDGVEITCNSNGNITGIGTGATDSHCGYTISDVTTTVDNAVMWDLPSKRAGA